MKREIGSEFYESKTSYDLVEDVPDCAWSGDIRYFVSGRTALHAILKEILLHRKCRRAYLPSYCCHTMIEPFIRYGLEVEFYTVGYREGHFYQLINPEYDCDIVFVMDYFGFTGEVQAVPENAIIIRDMTHAFFQYSNPDQKAANYLFASLRKWGAVAGAAIACKVNGHWKSSGPMRNHDTYIGMRREGYRLKKVYSEGGNICKEKFLELFKAAEELLDRDYVGYTADDASLGEISKLTGSNHARRENAKVLLSGMGQIKTVELIFSKLEESDTPLFVPIYVKNGKRDKLRAYLIQNGIYCPVHWPLSEYHTISSNQREIYECEMSLICDQRYEKKDMLRQIEMIRRFENNNG